MAYNIAVVGATGNVGREMLNILFERRFPVKSIIALASRRSLGTECGFGDEMLKTKDLDTFDFEGVDIALFAIGANDKPIPTCLKKVYGAPGLFLTCLKNCVTLLGAGLIDP